MTDSDYPRVPNQTASKPTVIFIMGPTASGKTDLAIELSKIIHSELVSVDSALVYKGMDIGSAKPDAETLKLYPHRLVDIRDPADPYSAADFVSDAQATIEKIIASGKTPILVGGTTLYFKTLVEGLDGLPPANKAIRADIEARADKVGWPKLHEELAQIDPQTASRLHPNHNQRIQRALEIYQLTGKTMTEIHGSQRESNFMDKYDLRQLAIMPSDRKTLHERIEKRLDLMFESGFIDEVKAMYERGDLHTELPSVRAVGYRQIWSFLENEHDLDEAKFRALVATRNLAKRQLTWLRSWPDLPILYTDQPDPSFEECSESSCEQSQKPFVDGRQQALYTDRHETSLNMSDIVAKALKLLNLDQYKREV